MLGRHGNRLRVVIGAATAAPQHQVTIGVAGGGNNRGLALAVDAEEMVGAGGGLHGIDRNGDAAVGAVLVTNRHRQPRGHLAVGLAFGGAGADGGPADQIGDVLGHHRIQQFRGRRQPLFGQLQQQSAGPAQAGVDVVTAVEMGVIDQPLPAHGGAWFFEINPHHHLQPFLVAVPQLGQGIGIFLSRPHVVH